jgi:glycosyltransferase involved in cell wall biosynthesis
MEKINISVIIITGNEEKNIEDCLKSVAWSDDIIVVDCFSKDKTVEISKRYTERVYLKEWVGYAKQKSYALSLAKNEWVLSLDADERATETLMREIINLFNSNPSFDGYYIPRQNYFLGRWIKSCGWYPNYQMRLFKKNKTRLSDKKVHERFEIDGEYGYLKNPMIHFTHQNIQDIIKKINEYSSLQAEEKAEKKKVYWFNIILNPMFAFFQFYILRGGFLEGMHGFLVSVIHALTKTLTYVKIWEIQYKEKVKKWVKSWENQHKKN